ncbi:hypothetical protein [Sedimenticola hydrogenitrophicus]|uniref:hypothetical protein n=1 Tax=Sedimenticola hydrogenitrophicus TaxID=2967975 RepID=UPI0023B1506C|nr:hypothetical protein [Sedimenticola hydrogenitrophicus]
MMNDTIASRYAKLSALAEMIHERLGDELWRMGFAEHEVTLMPPSAASYRLEKDVFSGAHALVGRWQDDQGMSRGSLVFHADGSFFVEQDIVKPHPRKKAWFVEALTAWGREATLQVESKLLPMPE